VRFAVPAGQFVCIVGPSGCGKTTLLHLISGLDTAVNGVIRVAERRPTENTEIGYMFQSPRLMPWLTVLENVMLVAKSDTQTNGRARALLAEMRLEDFVMQYPNRLSGGMQRRVALARAFINEPPLLLLDEPFISLDEPVADMLRQLLLDLWSRRRTSVVFVTHDLREALYLSDRILFMSRSPGRVVLDMRVDLPRPRDPHAGAMEELRQRLLSEHPSLLAGLAEHRDPETGERHAAGKTTLFQLLTGLFVPDSGSISIMNRDIRRDAVPALAHLGIVFQQPTLDPELSIRANLRFHAQLHGMERRRMNERINAELERVELTERANDRVRTLSGGNRRRVELARALLHDPKLLLMDEPTVGLDPASRRDILTYVLSLRAEKRVGVLWATHLVDEAQMAERVIVLHRGHVLRDTTPAQLVRETGAQSLDDAFLRLTASDEPSPLRGRAAVGS
jgi:NitT/TauT family transport system ATP-binding protein